MRLEMDRRSIDLEPGCGRLAGWEAWLAVAMAVLLVALLAVGWGLAPENLRPAFADAGWLLGLGGVLIIVVRVAGIAGLSPRARRAWSALAAGAALMWTVVMLGLVLPLIAPGSQRTIALLDVPLVFVALALTVVGLHCFSAMPARVADRMRQWLEVAILLVGSALVLWELVVAPDLAGDPTLSLDRVLLTLLVPGMLAVVVASLLTALAREREAEARRVLGRLTAGALVVLAAVWARALTGFAPSAVPPAWSVAAYWAGMVMVAAAAAHEGARLRHGRRVATDIAPDREVRALTAVTVGAVVAGYALPLAGALRMADLRIAGLLIGAGVMTMLLLVRQWVALRENAALSARLGTQVRTDELTGLGNRRALLEACAEPVDRLAVVVFDIDDFKGVNDRHGHAVGDRVLREVAARCRDQVRGNDLLGRLGGDEFMVLLPAAGMNGARRVAAALRAAVAAEPIAADGLTVAVTISLGVAAAPPDTLEELLAHADRALYEDKRARRGGLVHASTGGAG